MTAATQTDTSQDTSGGDTGYNWGLQLTDSNKFTGAGVLDSWGTLARAADELSTIDKSQKGEVAALSVEIGLSVLSGVADTVAFALDPFAKVIAAGLGWLIEHIGVLKQPLNELFGNPDEIRKIVEELKVTAQRLHQTAADFESSCSNQVKTWQGPSYDAFSNEMKQTKARIDNAGGGVDTSATILEVTNAVLSAFRGLVRDMITTVLGDIIATVLIGLALAPVTFGASLAVAIATSVGQAGLTMISYVAKLAKVFTFLGKTHGNLDKIPSVLGGSRPHPTAGGAAEAHPTAGGTSGAAGHDDVPLDTLPHGSGGAGGAGGPGHDLGAEGSSGAGAGAHADGPSGTGAHGEDPAGAGASGSSASGHGEDPAGAGPSGNVGTRDEPPASGQPHEDGAPSSSHDEEDPFETWLAADAHFNGPGAGSLHEPPSPTGSVHEPPAVGGHDAPASAGSIHEPAAVGGHDAPASTGSVHEPPAVGGHDAPASAGGTHEPPAGAGQEPAPAPAPASGGKKSSPKSKLAFGDIPGMKDHEKWLDGKAGSAWSGKTGSDGKPVTGQWNDGANPKFAVGTKSVDQWAKDHLPNAYPWIKAISDAKSSKNFFGAGDKLVYGFDKEITHLPEVDEQAKEEAEKGRGGSQPGSEGSQPGSGGNEPPSAGGSQPGPEGSQPGSGGNEPPSAGGSQPGPEGSQPGSGGSEPPSAGGNQPGSGGNQPGPEGIQPGNQPRPPADEPGLPGVQQGFEGDDQPQPGVPQGYEGDDQPQPGVPQGYDGDQQTYQS